MRSREDLCRIFRILYYRRDRVLYSFPLERGYKAGWFRCIENTWFLLTTDLNNEEILCVVSLMQKAVDTAEDRQPAAYIKGHAAGTKVSLKLLSQPNAAPLSEHRNIKICK